MLKAKLELLTKEFTLLKQKITQKLQTKEKSLLDTNKLLVESNQKVETLTKENQANEAILEKLIKEFKELGEQLG